MFDRRKVLTGLAGGAAALAAPGLPWLALGQQRPSLVSGLPSGVYDTAVLGALPGKKPLIKLSYGHPITRSQSRTSKPRSRRTMCSSCVITWL